ncbi:acyltransferase family protein [Asticcacaulis benevestitus]|uniref:Heparan-alpha-glucosaminide N-acetyltransferase catalytic domain-containing protein n=1 Tax=Asticcacaulis benevestitus DSM 16100 = ATCC BAA-896 TaxID=1121022 RepID=V4PIV8_9CAUL|nr:heparan-alpha-glucosaminide N-acetyltransferase domain-containing protein [Asticcacaulis benevestitus]ESQ88101.1 hypothetical protein ABENE_16360 [Asticcacaulis benevestitus DSM 16100 = ATCC BAA-896]
MTEIYPPNSRLVSLDVMRGLAVIGMILANATDGVKEGLGAHVFPQLLHEPWQGLHFADTVFPAFLMMMGVSVPMALTKAKVATGLNGEQFRRIFWRTFRLVFLGFLLVNLDWFAHFGGTTWRLFGVLQRIGLVYGACAILYFLCSPRVRLVIIAALLLLYWPLALLPQIDAGPSDIWVRGHNFIGSFDRVWLGAGGHNYVRGPEGYDPEGLLGTLPAVAHGLIGVAVGEWLQRMRSRDAGLKLALAGIGTLIAGCLWGFIFPVVKDIWSSPFVLVTCGLTTFLLAILHLCLDGREKVSVWALFPMAIGMNAMTAYVLDEVCAGMPTWSLFALPYHLSRPYIYEPIAALLPVIAFLMCIWLVTERMRRKGLVIKI